MRVQPGCGSADECRHERGNRAAALFLASDAASFCTGSVHMADGGMDA
jgi:enoyl-[acyl-carrier-protein] reductase (NADH)